MASPFTASTLNTMRTALRPGALTPAVREQLRAALNSEYALAAAMPDDVFWGYDAAWLTAGAPELVDVRRAGSTGGGGASMSWDNNQFWKLPHECDRGLFTLVMYQQRRYIAAQFRMRQHLASVPQPEVVAGFDALESTRNVRQACSGVHPKDRAQDWAYWCEEAVRLIGAARWASNFTWSDGLPWHPGHFGWGRVGSEWLTCGDAVYSVTGRELTGAQSGCEYEPDCSQDAYGVPRLGYVVGSNPAGIRQWRELVRQTFPYERLRSGVDFDLAAEWDLGRMPRNADRPIGFTVNTWPISVSPGVLGLHRSSYSAGENSTVPLGAAAFNGRWGLEPLASRWPSFLAKPADRSFGSCLFAYFLEAPLPGWEQQAAFRERTGCWLYRGDVEWSPGLYRKQAGVSPASEFLIWWLVAQMRDISTMPFGQVVIDGFGNLDRAVQGIPVELRGASYNDVAAQIKAVSDVTRSARAELVGGILSAATGVAAAVNPIAGAIVGLVAGLTVALTRFAVEVGLVRLGNPPALQFPAMRVAPPTLAGDDRCWVNPGELEALESYRVRVAAPYAEAARRTGGDPARMFDEIARIRTEQYCLANPADPRCQLSPPAASTAWAKYVLGALSAAGGFAAVHAFTR